MINYSAAGEGCKNRTSKLADFISSVLKECLHLVVVIILGYQVLGEGVVAVLLALEHALTVGPAQRARCI